MGERPPAANAEQWQKRYYRGLDMDDKPAVPDHRAKLRLKPFVHAAPQDATPTVSVDLDRLEQALAILAACVREGTRFDRNLLRAAGLSEAGAEGMIRAACVAG